jgi:murein DD-endopeptidase MepM/ murein hydrolase activator NlpD
MEHKGGYVTIMLIPDGTESRRGWRVRQWLLKTAVGFFILLIVGIMLFFIFYGRIVTRATMTEKLMAENEDLRRYQYKVELLEQNLLQAREMVSRMASLAGIDYEFPELPDDSTIFAELDKTGMAVIDRAGSSDFSLPVGLPLQGFISQEFNVSDSDHYHPGVDIACAVGTPVLATGSGEVIYDDFDSTYGNMVVIKHNDSVTTIYGHNEKNLVQVGQHVMVGSRIALSGNTGRSTAPHLHYELRINNKPVNPMDNPYDQKN